MTRFSQRHGFAPPPPDIELRHDAPQELRGVLVDIAYECGLTPHLMRSLVCRVLRVREDADNWSAFPNVDGEVRDHLDSSQWYEVYDVIEAVHADLARRDQRSLRKAAAEFVAELNDYFLRRGIGWQLRAGLIEVRGPATFEAVLVEAGTALADAGRRTASTELREALRDLSRRPEPDLTGALHHALASVECVARDVTGDSKATLGALLSRNKGVLPPPMDQAVEKLWGFASDRGRHLREGGEPLPGEVELAVHVAAAVANYLASRLPPLPNSETSPADDFPF